MSEYLFRFKLYEDLSAWNILLDTSSFFGERLGFVGDHAEYYVQTPRFVLPVSSIRNPLSKRAKFKSMYVKCDILYWASYFLSNHIEMQYIFCIKIAGVFKSEKIKNKNLFLLFFGRNRNESVFLQSLIIICEIIFIATI